MIQTIIADSANDCANLLSSQLNHHCPQVIIKGIAHSQKETSQLIEKISPELLMIEAELATNQEVTLFKQIPTDFEVVYLQSDKTAASEIQNYHLGNCLLKPIKTRDLLLVIDRVEHRIQWRKERKESRQLLMQLHSQSPPNDLIGIPSLSGMEFLKVEEIVRCEGLQRFTRVITTEGNSIISSYRIGKFKALLTSYGFFLTHKSHLVNLRHLRRYNVEGTLVMRDGSLVPVSRRRKCLFLERVQHL